MFIHQPGYKSGLKSKKLSHDPDKQRDEKAEQNHGSNGKIKPEILFLNPDIAGQAANPVQFIMKKINHYPDDYHQQAKTDNVFSCVCIHETNLNPQNTLSAFKLLISSHSLSFST